MLTLQAVSNGAMTSLALEQSSYCGMEEHTHTEDCYLENILVCNKKAHTHSENCYLLLLKENNINSLLDEMDRTEDKSLTSVMEHAVDQAIDSGLNEETDTEDSTATNDKSLILDAVEETTTGEAITEDVTSEPAIDIEITTEPAIENNTTTEPAIDNDVTSEPAIDQTGTDSAIDAGEDASTDSAIISTDSAIEGGLTDEETEKEDLLTKLEGTQIGDLNNAFQMNTSIPSIVLNENMVGLNASNAMLAADIVDEEAATGNNSVNFYVYFVDENGDGGWTFIGTETYSKVKSSSLISRSYWSVPYADVVALIKEEAMPGINPDEMGLDYYYVRANSSSSWAETGTLTSGNTSYITMGRANGNNTSNGTYSIYIGAGGTSPSAEPSTKFCRITYRYHDNSNSTNIIYYPIGTTVTLLSLTDGYVWQDQDGTTYQGSETIEHIAKSYEFDLKLLGYTVTFETNGGSPVESQSVQEYNTPVRPPDPTRTGYTFDGWYGDAACTMPYDFSAVITSNVTVYAKWIPEERTVTYLAMDGTVIITEPHVYDEVVTIMALPEGAVIWKDNSTLEYYDAGDALTVQKNYVLQAIAPFTVTLIDSEGETISSTAVIPGESFVLEAPESGYVWTDQSGHSYDSRTELSVNTNLTFTLKQYLKINYAVNWNSTSAGSAGITSGDYTVPTVAGGSTSSYIMTQGTTVTLYDVSSDEVTIDFPLGINSSARPGIAVFQGWKVNGTGEILRPGDVHTYSEMSAYAADGEVDLTGVWIYSRSLAVNFFIEYDSAGDSSANANDWTPVLYSTYYAGASQTSEHNVSKSTIEDQDGDGDIDNYDADIAIRARIDQSKSRYLYSFPTDEYVFEKLENYTSKLTVDGISVTAQELNEHGFTILWTKLAYVAADQNFHLDGLLVRKLGYIYVNKTFSGNGDAIESVKAGDYYISAVSQEDGTTETLTLDNYESYDPATNTYTWIIRNVAYGEEWELKEHNYTATVNGVAIDPYMEYTISDALGSQSKHDEYTGSITVTGQTYDSTISTDEVLTVSMNNIYQGTDTFILKKEDLDTGNALAGASFALYQNGELLKFNYSDGVYTCAVDGTVTELDCTSGFLEITVNGLDFSQGDIVVRETQTPEGYISLADDVGLSKDGDFVIVKDGNSTAARIQNGVLIIGNTSTTATVTVTKAWTNPSDARDVVVNLLANGDLVTTLFPDLSGVSAIVTLNEAGDFKYTWDNLPAYADGNLIQWSVTETRIGEERANSDGSFDNWTVLYSNAQTTQDGEGNTTVNMTVTNSRKSGNTFVVHKVSESGRSLPGAEFLLQMLDGSGNVSSDFTAQSGVTDASGLVTFTGLPFGTYQLTEVSPPPGYVGAGVSRFTVNSDRTVTMIDDADGAATAVTGAMAVRVVNGNGRMLPATGGNGPYVYYTLGLMCILMAVCFTILPKLKEKGGKK